MSAAEKTHHKGYRSRFYLGDPDLSVSPFFAYLYHLQLEPRPGSDRRVIGLLLWRGKLERFAGR